MNITVATAEAHSAQTSTNLFALANDLSKGLAHTRALLTAIEEKQPAIDDTALLAGAALRYVADLDQVLGELFEVARLRRIAQCLAP